MVADRNMVSSTDARIFCGIGGLSDTSIVIGTTIVIKPLIKKTQLDPKDLANYRLISNLPFLSKILEKVASSQFCSFFREK